MFTGGAWGPLQEQSLVSGVPDRWVGFLVLRLCPAQAPRASGSGESPGWTPGGGCGPAVLFCTPPGGRAGGGRALGLGLLRWR